MPVLPIIAGAIALGASSAAMTIPTRLRLGPQGEILGWLVAGPFPNVGALQRKGTGFATDYLSGEASATGEEGKEIPMIPFEKSTDPSLRNPREQGWRLGIGDEKSGIDLARLLDGNKPGIAYLYTQIESDRDREAKLLFGSDDGAKVWLNGELIFSKQIARGIKRDEDSVDAHLKKGANQLLFKIEQGDGGWGLLARLADTNGEPIPSLVQVLNLSRTGKEKDPVAGWIRAAVGQPGSLDVSAAAKYEEISRTAKKWISRFGPEADDPRKLEDLLQAERDRVRAEGDSADAVSSRLETAADAIESTYGQARAPLLRKAQSDEPLLQTNVSKEDYVRPMLGGRYFVHADGKPFIPIGYNHNPDWPEFDEANPWRDRYDPAEPERYMAHLADSGVNVIRLMIETPPSGNLEDPVGTFQPEHVRWIDAIFTAARKHGIKLIVTPWDTFWMNRRWETTPYNPDNGGQVKERIDFITSPAVRRQQKRRLKFLIDHWGNTGTVFSWELLNEADLWWGANAGQLTEWTNDMADYVHGYEKQRWGRNHMLSVSFAAAMPKGEMAHLAYASAKLDYATTHLYIGVSKAPTEPIGPALAIQEGVRYAMGQIHDGRPYMDTENGPIDKWIPDATLDDEVFHNMTWAHLASGGAGSSFRWPYRHPHHLTEGMLLHLKHLSTFVKGVDWASLAGSRVPLEIDGSTRFGFATAKSALLWTPGHDSLTFHWDGPAKVRCRLFDTTTGKWIGESTIAKVAGAYTVPSSPDGSIAAIIK